MNLLFGAIRLALSAIARNKLRAALTVLGIFIGVTAVVMVTALAGGATQSVGSQIDSFASNALFINPEAVQQSGARAKTAVRLTENDGRAILREAVSVQNVAPWLSTQGQVVYGDKNVATLLVGTTTQYFPIRRYTIDKGELWNESDETLKTKVCVVGTTVSEKLFGTEDPVGRVIRIGRSPYRILGVLTPKGNSPFGEDQDDRILMPVGSYRARVAKTSPGRVDMLMASATSEQTTARAQEQITAVLRQRHRIGEGKDADFSVNTQAEIRAAQQAISSVLSGLLLSVAAVSLVVGGIGVMNIMLVSVAERTREIGIRMSIGARERDILVQFLVEAIVLSMMGGVLGIVVGGGLTVGLGKVLGWNTTPTAEAIGVAAATSAFIGVVFGFLPARRAASLDPIDALRTEKAVTGPIVTGFRLAISAIVRSTLRAGLTILGILIGVAAVVTVTALGAGAREQVSSQIQAMGSNVLMVAPQSAAASGARGALGAGARLTEDDGRAILREAVSVAAVAPALRGRAQIIAGERNWSAQVIGSNRSFFVVRSWPVAQGSAWDEHDENAKAKVCVLGTTVATKLFAGEDPIGRFVRIGRHSYRVTGVLESKGEAPFGGDQDNMVVMPISTMRGRVLKTAPGFAGVLLISATSAETTDRAMAQVDSILRQRHHIEEGREPDFWVRSQKEFQAMQGAIYGLLTVLLVCIAAVSLVVGGIGVMNIMLVSVTERTREIGIRMAIGAQAFDILVQFLVEAVVLASIGGVTGALVGLGAIRLLGDTLGWPMKLDPVALGIAVATSALTGIAFGFFPARRAARLDPIVALRHE